MKPAVSVPDDVVEGAERLNGNVVATGSYFGVDMSPLVDRLPATRVLDWSGRGA